MWLKLNYEMTKIRTNEYTSANGQSTVQLFSPIHARLRFLIPFVFHTNTTLALSSFVGQFIGNRCLYYSKDPISHLTIGYVKYQNMPKYLQLSSFHERVNKHERSNGSVGHRSVRGRISIRHDASCINRRFVPGSDHRTSAFKHRRFLTVFSLHSHLLLIFIHFGGSRKRWWIYERRRLSYWPATVPMNHRKCEFLCWAQFPNCVR